MRITRKKNNKIIKIIIPAVLAVALLAGLLGYYFMEEPEEKVNKVYRLNDIIEYGPLVIDGMIDMPTYNAHSVAEHVSPSEREELNAELDDINEKIEKAEEGNGEHRDLLDKKEDIEYKLFKANVGAIELFLKNPSDEVVTVEGEYIIKNKDNEVIESYSLQSPEDIKQDNADYMNRLKREEGFGGEKLAPGEEKQGYLFHNQAEIEDLILKLDLFDDHDPIDIKLYLVNLGL